ncbi:hypothetical protein WBG78_15530 [Chryseolinea sp. T2]|uniref:hypothetical protein n=1 Tax=Chryseolinea sp. T2 TaxID=3129255 RepID=UPI003077DC6A
MKTLLKVVLTATLALLVTLSVCAQKKSKPSMFDSLDHKLDMSDFLIEANGFIPVPVIVTEPALGGFGLGVAPIFITRRKPTVDKSGKAVRIPPDVTGGVGMYTVNNTWAALAFRQGTWLKAGSKYRAGGGYANINMKFYRNTAAGKEFSTEFNLRTTPFTGSLLKRFGSTPWSAGVDYTFLNTKVSVDGGSLPDFVKSKEINSRVSMPGLTLEFDSRDNIFTPNKGIRSQVNVSFSDDGFGSDYNYQNLNAFIYGYFQMFHNVVTGLRYEMQQVFGDVPFYLEPYVDLRGVPTARYQGNIFSVGEVEVRWDIVSRWSVVGFGGAGKAYDSWGEFKNASWVGSGGGGFRYLIARKFKVRMGVDLARGPEQWAYYIVFGSSWLR